MSALFLPALLASLAGGLHCAGMCGPFSAACGLEPNGQARLIRQVPYHLGRLVTYGTLGGAAGAFGGALDLGGDLVGFSQLSALFAGLTMVAFGVAPFLSQRKLLGLGRGPRSSAGLFTRLLARSSTLPPPARALLLGLTTTLLPCGWLYAFVALAAGTGSFVSGLTVMVGLWLGSLPWLFGAALGLRALVPRFGARARQVSAALIGVSGLALIALRAGPALGSKHGVHDAPNNGIETRAPTTDMANCPFHSR